VLNLTGNSGGLKGRTWPITETPLLIGRDRNCSVRVLDPVVSRRQCEIVLDGDAVRLTDLGGVNPTLVNGLAADKCLLSIGDEIRIGRNVFLITRTTEVTEDVPSEVADTSTLTISEEESSYLGAPPRTGETSAIPARDRDLYELFTLARSFSRATSTAALTGMLTTALQARFGPVVAWLVLFRGEDEEWMTLCTPGILKAEFIEPPRALMFSALRRQRGELIAAHFREGGRDLIRSTFAAPIFLGEHRIGILAIRREAPPAPPDSTELDYLVALANVVAPLFRAVERIAQLEFENRRLQAANDKLPRLIGKSREMDHVREMIRLAAPSPHPILILGETGTGKEIAATLVHELSACAQGPLVTVNCAAIPRELFESEFFGHERGAFTGATQRKIGLLEQSHNGTLFLDEVGDLAFENQARILRALETKQFRRLGGKDEIHVDFRVVSATNKDLWAMVAQGGFRPDLYHRIRGIEVRIPPLRERRADIPELAAHFLREACAKIEGPERTIAPKAMEYLAGQSWPGNVRALKQCIEAAATIGRAERLEIEDFWFVANGYVSQEALLPMTEVEKRHILHALRHCNGNVVETAKLLGIGKSTLYNKIAEYGLKP